MKEELIKLYDNFLEELEAWNANREPFEEMKEPTFELFMNWLSFDHITDQPPTKLTTMKLSKTYVESIMHKSSGGLAQKDRENATLALLLEIRDLLTPTN